MPLALRRLHASRTPITIAVICLCHGWSLAQEPPTLATVEVVSTTLLPGLGTPIQNVPANVQLHSGEEMNRQRPNNLSDYLEWNATSVNVNAAQGNPYQPDISFRGFTASPLLGLPQGLSVFQDGVRVNEPFGDVVNWDLIPASAIAGIQLMPGSNPAFGLNTLGGALSVITKSGLTHPGGAVQVQGGSFGRQAVEFEQGGKHGDWHYFLTGNAFSDKGWGEHNPSQVQQFFGKVGYVSAQTTLDLSLTAADNTLEGSQTLPLSFSSHTRQAYTYPDQNQNQLAFLNLKGSHLLSEQLFLDGNAYYRQYRNQNISSNLNGNYDPTATPSVTTAPTNDRSLIDQSGYGLGLQLTSLGELAGKKNQLVAGVSADFGEARYSRELQDAAITADRGSVGTGAFTLDTLAQTRNSYYGIYLNNTLALNERWALTLSGRHNLAHVKIDDQMGTALNGDHAFVRFNPAVGLNFKPAPHFTAYAAYNEGMRAPTPIELTCADPSAPCKLPNSFLSDPPLKMVVARTVEIGARGKVDRSLSWSAAFYRTELQDDIQFITSGANTTGYFQNIGNTLRQGIELALAQRWKTWGLSLRYGYLDATYQSAFQVNSAANSSATDGVIQVSPGNRMPGLPRHTLKLRLDHDFNAQWNLGLSVLLSSGVYARGDENNQDAGGQVPGYAVVNLDSRYKASKQIEVFGRINNLFDQRYANFATLGQNYFPGYSTSFTNAPINEQFRGYGAPRGAWVGIRYSWP